MEQKVLLKVTKDIFRKINYLCNNISSVEWSGTLFYTITGNLKNGTAKIVLRDILPLDIGTGSYTEFKADERFIEFLMDKQEAEGDKVLTWQQGLIHSHNNMQVFFSGTDREELLESCPNYNQYLSFICNNRNEFCAKVAQNVVFEETRKGHFEGLTTKGKKQKIFQEEVLVKRELQLVYDCEIEVPEVKDTMDPIFKKYFSKMKKHTTRNYEQWGNGMGYSKTKTYRGKNGESLENKRVRPQEDWNIAYVSHQSGGRSKETERFIQYSDIVNFLEDDETSSDEVLARADEIYYEFAMDEELIAKDFMANLITHCNNKKLDIIEEAERMEKFITDNSGIGTTYLNSISATIIGTITEIIKRRKENGGTTVKV